MRTLILLVLVLFTPLSFAKKPQTISTPAAYGIWDLDSKKILADKNIDSIRSMASITKVMTVLVVLEQNLDLEESLVVTAGEHSYYIRPGMVITRQELIRLTLISSDNLAARTLSETSGMSYHDFIAIMNIKARTMGMIDTKYFDPVGLSPFNVSTIYDIKILTESTEKHPIFTQTAMTSEIRMSVIHKNKKKMIVAHNTNIFAGKMNIIGAKTGFTNAAGRCLTMFFKGKDDHRYILVVLGATTNDQRHRMVNKLIDTIR